MSPARLPDDDPRMRSLRIAKTAPQNPKGSPAEDAEVTPDCATEPGGGSHSEPEEDSE